MDYDNNFNEQYEQDEDSNLEYLIWERKQRTKKKGKNSTSHSSYSDHNMLDSLS